MNFLKNISWFSEFCRHSENCRQEYDGAVRISETAQRSCYAENMVQLPFPLDDHDKSARRVSLLYYGTLTSCREYANRFGQLGRKRQGEGAHKK